MYTVFMTFSCQKFLTWFEKNYNLLAELSIKKLPYYLYIFNYCMSVIDSIV